MILEKNLELRILGLFQTTSRFLVDIFGLIIKLWSGLE